jgi:hypothetical protein
MLDGLVVGGMWISVGWGDGLSIFTALREGYDGRLEIPRRTSSEGAGGETEEDDRDGEWV